MNPYISSIVTKIFPKKSRARRLQYQWLSQLEFSFAKNEKVLDLGGVANAEYHRLLQLCPEQMLVWNFDPSSKPDQIVDLEKIEKLPPLPPACKGIIALNLLEHLYKPFDLLEWACKQLPSEGKILLLVPFHYPIHPSPKDYWRITPQAFERFFSDLAKENVRGKYFIASLGEDLREGANLITANLFKASPWHRVLGTWIEWKLWLLSKFIPKSKLKNWVAENPVSIGVLWTRD